MFNFGWRKKLKKELTGLSLVEAVDYFDLHYTKYAFYRDEIQKALDELQFLNEKQMRQGVENENDFIKAATDFQEKNIVKWESYQTALQVGIYKSLTFFAMAEVWGASQLMREQDFGNYVLSTVKKNSAGTSLLVMTLFPPHCVEMSGIAN